MLEFSDIAKHINAEQEVLDVLDEHLQQYNALLEACKAVVDDTKLPIRGTLQAQLRAAISQAEKE